MARRRTSSIQMDHLLNRMEGNNKLAHGNTSRSDVKKLWCQVTDELNRKGSHKTVIEWQKVWQSWVLRVRTKARKINQLIRGTGGGPPADVLSDMKERVLKVTGKGAITGVLNMETALEWQLLVLWVWPKACKINQILRGAGRGPLADSLTDCKEQVIKVTGKGAVKSYHNLTYHQPRGPWRHMGDYQDKPY